jgi:predicted molibdopterin-dependent oxidoreductase YjgC
MSEPITFILDGREVEALADETIWQTAKRLGTTIPHLCWKDAPGYRADGNCRACMVEVEGERVLAASCIRKPARHEGQHEGPAFHRGAQHGDGTAGHRPARARRRP